MKAVVQRVRRAAVSSVPQGADPSAPIVRSIDRGLMILIGFEEGDTESDRSWMAAKLVGLRIFEDDAGRMNRAVTELGDGGILLVPNFTLAGDVRKGKRPSFDRAMKPELAAPEFERFVGDVRAQSGAGVRVERGEFRATMLVSIENDGPVTLIVDSRGAAAAPDRPA